MRDDLQDYVVEHLGDERAVLALDETSFLKKRGHFRSGSSGRICFAALRARHRRPDRELSGPVFLGYASRHDRALIDRALYLPED